MEIICAHLLVHMERGHGFCKTKGTTRGTQGVAQLVPTDEGVVN